MGAWRSAIARILIALALIVQIWAPVGSSVAMVSALMDPLAGVLLCEHDPSDSSPGPSSDPGSMHHGEACGLCLLVGGAGFAPPPVAPVAAIVQTAVAAADWTLRIEIVASARLLDQIRGRAPPALS